MIPVSFMPVTLFQIVVHKVTGTKFISACHFIDYYYATFPRSNPAMMAMVTGSST